MRLFNIRNALLVVALALVLKNFNVLNLLGSASSSEHLYNVLGLPRSADADDIRVAYDGVYWPLLKSMEEEPRFSTKQKLIDIQHAYDTLSDERQRRIYDSLGLDELKPRVQEMKKRIVIEGDLSFPGDQSWQVEQTLKVQLETVLLTSQNFAELVLESNVAWVILIYSETSIDSHELVSTWNGIGKHLEGVAKVGHVEVGQFGLSTLLAEKPLFSKEVRFMSGLPEVVVFTDSCRQVDCLRRYRGVKTEGAVLDWVTTSVLNLPRILYYNSKALMEDFIQGAPPHKVKVLVFSNDGERALPYIRQAAKQNWQHTQFAMVLWQEQSERFWESRVGVASAPALVFVKDPGLQPVVYYGTSNSSHLENLMQQHKSFVLPQLRSASAESLGCDARGQSMAGNGTTTWYCVIVAGRAGRSLNQIRGVLRGVRENLEATKALHNSLAAEALRSSRLSISWLDGEKQQRFCYFYLQSPNMFEACGPSRNGAVEDAPKIFLVRYQREALTAEVQAKMEQEKALRAKNLWASLLNDHNENVASQLVSKYNGSVDVDHIVEWLSQMVFDGDNHKLPSFRGKMPELIPEEKIPFWVQAKKRVADGQAGAIEKSRWFTQALSWVTQRA